LVLDGIFHGIDGEWIYKALIIKMFFLQKTIEWE